MKKFLTAFTLVAMLTVGTGVVGASDNETVEDTNISVVDSSYTTMKRPIAMD